MELPSEQKKFEWTSDLGGLMFENGKGADELHDRWTGFSFLARFELVVLLKQVARKAQIKGLQVMHDGASDQLKVRGDDLQSVQDFLELSLIVDAINLVAGNLARTS